MLWRLLPASAVLRCLALHAWLLLSACRALPGLGLLKEGIPFYLFYCVLEWFCTLVSQQSTRDLQTLHCIKVPRRGLKDVSLLVCVVFVLAAGSSVAL